MHCVHCHEPLGAYEPAFVRRPDGTEVYGSRLTLEEELRRPGSVAMHESCRAALARQAES